MRQRARPCILLQVWRVVSRATVLFAPSCSARVPVEFVAMATQMKMSTFKPVAPVRRCVAASAKV